MMVSDIYQEAIQTGKQYLPNPYPAHKIIIKKKTLALIMELKGWRTYTKVATALGFTRQYVAMIANGSPVSAEFIVRITLAMGNIKDGWYLPFVIVPRGEIHDNHPAWNKLKHDGEVPYEQYSISADLRTNDYTVERKEKVVIEKIN